MQEKIFEQNLSNLNSTVGKKQTIPKCDEIESILNFDNFSSKWKCLLIDDKNASSEWEQLLAIPDFFTNEVGNTGDYLSKFFEYTNIGKFEHYHRAGRNIFKCVHRYDQKGAKIIEKFIIEVIKKEIKFSNIHVIGHSNQVCLVFR